MTPEEFIKNSKFFYDNLMNYDGTYRPDRIDKDYLHELMQAYADKEVEKDRERIIIEIKCKQEFTHPSMYLAQNRFNDGLKTAIEIIKNTKPCQN